MTGTIELLEARNPVWRDINHTIVDVEARFSHIPDWAAFTALDGSGEDHTQDVWDRVMSGEFGEIAEYVAPQPQTPEEARAAMSHLTARQLRLGLLSLGKLNDVPAAISALRSPEKEQAEIEWQYASEFRRLHPLIVQLIPILGLTDEQVDSVWQEYAQV